MSGEAGSPRVVFRCDANDTIGGGHAMRCLTLANALAEKGARVTFVTAAMPEPLEKRIAGAGHDLLRIPTSPELQRNVAEWEEPPLSTDAQLADAKATGAAVRQADWLVVDHYLLDANWHSEARSFAKRLLVIDDLANRSYDCDLLLDQNLGRSTEDYRHLVPSGAKLLIGATYALLRPEFARERRAALDRRRTVGPVHRILISMGTADPGGVTAPVVEEVLAAAPECGIDVVLGPQAMSLEQIRELASRHSSISVHVNSDRMAELMRDADVAIGAAGTTSWERCCLGLPSIALVLAENQREGASALDEAGAVIASHSSPSLAALVGKLLESPSELARMSAASFSIADGLGTSRVLDNMSAAEDGRNDRLQLRQAGQPDNERLWLWRNDPLTRSMAKTPDPITWSEHEQWFRQVLRSDDTTLYIVELSGEPAAMVRFDLQGDRALVSINVAPQLRGRGVGVTALSRACDAFEAVHPKASLWAEIRHANVASKAAFGSVGFEEVASATAGLANFSRRRAECTE